MVIINIVYDETQDLFIKIQVKVGYIEMFYVLRLYKGVYYSKINLKIIIST